MQFLTPDQAQSQPYRSEYRYGVAWTVILLAITLAITIASAWGVVRLWGREWLAVFGLSWLVVWFFLFTLVLRSLLRARLKPGGWLVRTRTGGMLLKFRSYMNHQFSSDDPVVAHLSHSEIEWIREHRVDRNIPGAVRGEDTRSRHRYVEFKLHGNLAREIEHQLAAERQRKGPPRPKWLGNGYSYSPHYPVQTVEGGWVRVEWSVRPGIKVFLEDMAPYVSVASAERTTTDFRALGSLDKAEQERRLLELIETGNRMDAIRAARQIYKMDLTSAVQFIDELSTSNRRPG